jgi:hypothetical protein
VQSAAFSTSSSGILGGCLYAILHPFSARNLRTCTWISCHQAADHNDPIIRRNRGIQTIHILCCGSVLCPHTDCVVVVRRSVLGSFYAALETSVLTLMTQMTVRVTPPFNLTLLAVTGRMSSSVRDYVSKLLFATLRLTGPRNRVRRVGSDLELCHRRPPGYDTRQNVSAEWLPSSLT